MKESCGIEEIRFININNSLLKLYQIIIEDILSTNNFASEVFKSQINRLYKIQENRLLL